MLNISGDIDNCTRHEPKKIQFSSKCSNRNLTDCFDITKSGVPLYCST